MMNTKYRSRRASNQSSTSSPGRADLNSKKNASSSSYSSRKPPANAGQNPGSNAQNGRNAGKNIGRKKFQFLPPIIENEGMSFGPGFPWDRFDNRSASTSTGRYASRPNAYSTRTTRIVSGWGESGCVVAAMAGATGNDYGDVRSTAMRHGFVPNSGMMFGPARDALSDLGANAVYHSRQPDSWSEFPRKAIVGVRGSSGRNHAVILKGDYIYDCNESRPIHRDNYQILDDSSYIELD